MTPPHILCVNPWIHDFAAFDFWAKPLGLLQLASILRAGGADVSFLDCLDRFHPEAVKEKKVKILSDGRGPFRKTTIPTPQAAESALIRFPVRKQLYRYGIEPEWFRQDLKDLDPESKTPGSTIPGAKLKPDLILVTSLMTYWASGVRETISVIKEIYPDVPVALGGIYATLCSDHARQYSLADRVVTGQGETQIWRIVKEYTGFSLNLPEDWGIPGSSEKQTDSATRLTSKSFDALPWPALDLVTRPTYAPILTSRGCPFSCTYCASSFLEPTMIRRSPESVFDEIVHWHTSLDITNFAFYDDALLIDPANYILPLLEKLCSYTGYSVRRLSFHTPNALHIRQITDETAEMMFRAGFHTIRLGLETTDFSPSRKEDIKVKKDEFYRAVETLKKAGFNREQIGAYLLCALPGQNLEDVEHSITLVKEAGILPVLAYYTPIPHTPMWEKAVLYSPLDIIKDPLFTNNALLPSLSNEHEIKKISELKKMTK